MQSKEEMKKVILAEKPKSELKAIYSDDGDLYATLRVDKDFMNDKWVSLKAKGLYTLLLLHVDDDQPFTISKLVKCSKDGYTATHSGLKELEQAGYYIPVYED